MDKISVIVPCYNEEEGIVEFYNEVRKHLEEIENTQYELIFIDDGSKDGTLKVMRELCRKDPDCHYLAFSRNFGKEAAMYAGLQNATGDYCVIMDADLQHPPELLKPMYHAVSQEGYDCCGGKRLDRTGEGTVRNWLSRRFYGVMNKLTNMEIQDGVGDFRMMSRKMTEAVLMMKEYNRYTKGIFAFVGFETKWLEFHNRERCAGTSKWNFKSLFSYALEGVLAFSTIPLTYAGIFGSIFIAISLIAFLVLGGFWIAGKTITLLMLFIPILLLISGIQMIFMYILGCYFSRDYMENKKRPIYIVKEQG